METYATPLTVLVFAAVSAGIADHAGIEGPGVVVAAFVGAFVAAIVRGFQGLHES